MNDYYVPSTEEIKGQACRLGGWQEAAFDRWLEQVQDEAYQQGRADALGAM